MTQTDTVPARTPLFITSCLVLSMGSLTVPFVISAIKNRIPFMPTTNEKIGQVIRGLRQVIQQPTHNTSRTVSQNRVVGSIDTNGLKFVDMGSGDGRMVISMSRQLHTHNASHRYMFRECVGIEYNMTLWIWSWIHARCVYGIPSSRVRLFKRNMWTYDLSDTDVVMVFGVPERMVQFRDKFEQEMKRGSIVITNKFPVPGWTPMIRDGEIYIYKI